MTTLCKFCRNEDGPNPATTHIKAANHEYDCCEDCMAEFNEQMYQDYIAETSYQDYIDGEPLASVDHARLLP